MNLNPTHSFFCRLTVLQSAISLPRIYLISTTSTSSLSSLNEDNNNFKMADKFSRLGKATGCLPRQQCTADLVQRASSSVREETCQLVTATSLRFTSADSRKHRRRRWQGVLPNPLLWNYPFLSLPLMPQHRKLASEIEANKLELLTDSIQTWLVRLLSLLPLSKNFLP